MAQRFIPACAGNSNAGASSPPSSPVHPRVCGELWGVCRAHSESSGSSPRVRGTPRSIVRHGVVGRFIPACAGNSRNSPGSSGEVPVHPRVCGELTKRPKVSTSRPGSSPRVRGTRCSSSRRRAVARFIPACAGNSPAHRRRPSPAPVHPRVCGELIRGRLSCGLMGGSSPRVRGTRPLAHQPQRRHRFIPACAGNSAPPWCG